LGEEHAVVEMFTPGPIEKETPRPQGSPPLTQFGKREKGKMNSEVWLWIT